MLPLLLLALAGCAPDTDREVFLIEWTRNYSNVPIIENATAAHSSNTVVVGVQPIARIDESSGGDLCSITRVYRFQSGDIVISDSCTPQVVVFDSTGRFKRRIERVGDGPGEYRQLRSIRVLPDDTILIYAPPDRLISLNADGGYLSQQRVPSGVRLRPFGTRDLETVLAEPPDPARGWYAYEPLRNHGVVVQMAGTPEVTGFSRGKRLYGIVRPGDSLVIDTVGWFPEGGVIRDADGSAHRVKFSPATVTAFGNSYIYIGDGATYEIGQYDLNGRLLRRIRRTTPRVAVSPADRRLAKEMHQRALEGRQRPQPPPMRFEIADVHPHFDQLITDDRDYLWVHQRNGRDGASQVWAVFDTVGRLVEDVVMQFPPTYRVRRVDRTSVMVQEAGRLTPELAVFPISRKF